MEDFLRTINETSWFILGLVLLIIELATGTTILLWPAVAAGLTGLATLIFPMGVLTQIAVFGALTIVLTAVGRPLVRNRWFATPAETPTLNERDNAMVGARGAAQAAFVNGVGTVKLGDSVWRAVSGEPIEAGQMVEVESVEGATVRVRAIAP